MYIMNKQYVKGVQKKKMSELRLMDSKMATLIMILCFNGEVRDNVCTVPETEAKKKKKIKHRLPGPSTDTPTLQKRQLFIVSL